ncbi:hypothetical protein C7B65_07355 [Phormidesmis priestleyi ULC007]|uniref:Uncharacterized protein n=1 Tax=Phormidesmis priestleyi ULC007 TaxID=1920490 RepID=A0A2T1DJT6_9CYAN|nr:hypothetical protein C7B65_07355 [Phormidesmis priestleyi ULC007]PZO47133.1 MAG: hypothetical protein DCF14_20820 [Phormidesmis priestleyi]
MTPDPAIVKAVERLDYRVTVGDVAAQAGLDVNLAERGLLVLASAAGGQLQVAESGEVVYLFSQDFQTVLRNKFFQLQVKEWLDRIWQSVFYLIRISFGIVLMVLIALAIVAIIILVLAVNSSRDDNNDNGGGIGMPNMGFPDLFWIFYPNYYDRYDRPSPRRRNQGTTGDINFLEAVFSFLFGDGNPNADLEERRWQAIATVIRNNRGAVIAEQVAPFLDDVGTGYDQEYEQYMLPVLARFNGRPEVSPEGQIVYHFPDLQTTVVEPRRKSVADYLQEYRYVFSRASRGQKIAAASLGALLLALAIVLNVWLSGGIALVGAADTFVRAIAVLSLGYSAAYLSVPLIRNFWIGLRNRKISDRNGERQQRARLLEQADPTIAQKLSYAQQFAAETVIHDDDLIYTTERDLIDQESDRSAQIDAEWQKRLESE